MLATIRRPVGLAAGRPDFATVSSNVFVSPMFHWPVLKNRAGKLEGGPRNPGILTFTSYVGGPHSRGVSDPQGNAKKRPSAGGCPTTIRTPHRGNRPVEVNRPRLQG